MKSKRKLSYMENLKYKTIKKVISGEITKMRAEQILNCTRRTINRNIKRLSNEGISAFIHKNWGKLSNRSTPYEIEQKILNLRNEKYHDYNLVHFKESLEEYEYLKVSYTYLRDLLFKNEVYSPYMHRSTRKELIRQLRQKSLENKLTNKEQEFFKDKIISLEECRPMQNRKEYFGERIQTDACSHNWVTNEKWSLHAFIDDSTGKVLAGYFDYQETLFGYYTATKQMFLNYGTPEEILTDKRTVFYYKTKEKESTETDSNIQYAFTCQQLGIKLTSTSCAQTKGKIERLWGSFQKRLPQELRQFNIKTIEQANDYLINVFIPNFNHKFSTQIDNNKNKMKIWNKNTDINFVLARREERQVHKGGIIKYKTKTYLTYDGYDITTFASKTKLLITETYDNELYANYTDKFYRLVEVKTKNTPVGQVNEVKKTESKIKKPSVPSNHFRYTNYIYFSKTWKEQYKNRRFTV
ncbi:ISNCY family transposase [Spiroplasma endosymbiont of Cantharis lateralis]|uniref:ISNCY family transposase n=1 Tax=Spiroplasma endosymbiont of Cantharis lateralis TaxID=3066277 RepID=UPI00313A9DF6